MKWLKEAIHWSTTHACYQYFKNYECGYKVKFDKHCISLDVSDKRKARG